MIPGDLHDFFVASASVAGALIGLLFVAISVAGDRLAEREEMQVNRIRAHAALVAFVNAVVIGLFSLIPGLDIGDVLIPEGVLGMLFIAGSLLSLIRMGRLRANRRRDLREAAFLLGLVAALLIQLVAGVAILARPHDTVWTHRVAILVVFEFSIGIARAWELIGGPTIGFRHEVSAMLRQAGERGRGDGA